MASPGLRGVNGQRAVPPYSRGPYAWSNKPGDEFPRGQTGSYSNTPWLKFDLYVSHLTMPCRDGAIKISLTRTADYATSSTDGNPDTALKIQNTNAAVCTGSSGYVRAIDYQARSNGNCVEVTGINGNTRVSVGATATSVIGITHRCEIYGTVSTTLIGVDINMSNEGAAATTSAGLRIRNTNASTPTAIGSAILVTSTDTVGFDYLIDSVSTDCINTAVLRVYDDGTVAKSTGATGSFTNGAGYLTIKVGTATRYIHLASAAPTA